MNRITLFFCSLLLASGGFAQSEVVAWKFESKKISDRKYEVRIMANVKNPWHIYSSTQAEGGPLPTKILFAKNPLVIPEGKLVEEGKMLTHFEEVFDINTKYYNEKVDFVQVVNVKAGAKTTINGTVEFMACTDKECLPPKSIPFSIALK